MYRVARTEIPGESFRPFSQRLGVYTPTEFVTPTWSDGVFQRAGYPFFKSGFNFREGSQSVGMGQLDLSSISSSPLFWLAAAAGGYWLYRKYGR